MTCPWRVTSPRQVVYVTGLAGCAWWEVRDSFCTYGKVWVEPQSAHGRFEVLFASVGAANRAVWELSGAELLGREVQLEHKARWLRKADVDLADAQRGHCGDSGAALVLAAAAAFPVDFNARASTGSSQAKAALLRRASEGGCSTASAQDTEDSYSSTAESFESPAMSRLSTPKRDAEKHLSTLPAGNSMARRPPACRPDKALALLFRSTTRSHDRQLLLQSFLEWRVRILEKQTQAVEALSAERNHLAEELVESTKARKLASEAVAELSKERTDLLQELLHDEEALRNTVVACDELRQQAADMAKQLKIQQQATKLERDHRVQLEKAVAKLSKERRDLLQELLQDEEAMKNTVAAADGLLHQMKGLTEKLVGREKEAEDLKMMVSDLQERLYKAEAELRVSSNKSSAESAMPEPSASPAQEELPANSDDEDWRRGLPAELLLEWDKDAENEAKKRAQRVQSEPVRKANLGAELKKAGLRRVSVEGDGACFFYALSVALYASELRAKTVQFAKDNWSDVVADQREWRRRTSVQSCKTPGPLQMR